MAKRLSGRFTIITTGTGTQSGGTLTGISGQYADQSGATFGTDVSVGDYVHAVAPGGATFRWRITAVQSATITDLTVDLAFDDPQGNFPASANASPIVAGDAVITSPVSPGGASIVPSQASLQIPEPLVQAVNTTNSFYESGGLQLNENGEYDLGGNDTVGAVIISGGSQQIDFDDGFLIGFSGTDGDPWEVGTGTSLNHAVTLAQLESRSQLTSNPDGTCTLVIGNKSVTIGDAIVAINLQVSDRDGVVIDLLDPATFPLFAGSERLDDIAAVESRVQIVYPDAVYDDTTGRFSTLDQDAVNLTLTRSRSLWSLTDNSTANDLVYRTRNLSGGDGDGEANAITFEFAKTAGPTVEADVGSVIQVEIWGDSGPINFGGLSNVGASVGYQNVSPAEIKTVRISNVGADVTPGLGSYTLDVTVFDLDANSGGLSSETIELTSGSVRSFGSLIAQSGSRYAATAPGLPPDTNVILDGMDLPAVFENFLEGGFIGQNFDLRVNQSGDLQVVRTADGRWQDLDGRYDTYPESEVETSPVAPPEWSVAVFGDSLLNGVASQGRIEASFDSIDETATVTDLATGGFRIDQVREEWDGFEASGVYHEVALLQVGINDVINPGTVNPTLPDMIAALRSMIDEMIASQFVGRVVLLNYSAFGAHATLWSPENEAEIQALRAEVESYSGVAGVDVVDTFTALVDPGTYPGPQPELNPTLANNDQLHWNSTAQSIVSDLVRDSILS